MSWLVVFLIVAFTGLTAWILVWDKGVRDIENIEHVFRAAEVDVPDEVRSDWARDCYWVENAE